MPQLIRAEYLICDPDLLADGVITDGALVVDNGEILAAGAWRDLQNEYGHLTPLGGPDDWLAMPGLVNAHHHGRGLGTLAAGMDDNLLELWLTEFIRYPDADTYCNTLYAAARMLRSGITTSIQSHSSGGLGSAFRRSVEGALAAYRDAGVRVTFAMGLLDQNSLANYVSDEQFVARLPASLQSETRRYFNLERPYIESDAYFELFDEIYRQCGTEYPRAQLILSPIGLQWASDGLLMRMANAAEYYATGIHLHLLETMYQRTYVRHRFGKSAVEVLADFDLLGPNTSLAHGIWLTETELEQLGATETTVVTNTSSNMRLGSGLLPLQALRSYGINVALGLDSTSLFDDEDMFQEMRLVTTVHRTPGLEGRGLSPYEVLRMATVDGARAALLSGTVGKLLPGYKADVTILDTGRICRPYISPDIDIVTLALARARASDVDTVLVEGDVLVRDGVLCHLDTAQIEAKLRASILDAEPESQTLNHFLTELGMYVRDFLSEWELSAYQPYYKRNSRTTFERSDDS